MARFVRRPRAALAAFAAVSLLALAAGLAQAATGVKMTETGERYHFTPPAITVAAGSTVTWQNTTDAPHTVTADGGSFGSGTVAAEGTFSHTFTTAGTFAYHCTIHPYMTGTVVVTAASSGGAGGAGSGSGLPPTSTSGDGAPQQVPGIGLAVVLALGLGAGAVIVLRRRATAG